MEEEEGRVGRGAGGCVGDGDAGGEGESVVGWRVGHIVVRGKTDGVRSAVGTWVRLMRLQRGWWQGWSFQCVSFLVRFELRASRFLIITQPLRDACVTRCAIDAIGLIWFCRSSICRLAG